VFVSVAAVWPSDNSTAEAGDNAAVVWDSIITQPSSDHLSTLGTAALRKLRRASRGMAIDRARGRLVLKNQKAKYAVTSPTGNIAETRGVRLEVRYSVQPWVGILTWGDVGPRGIGRWKEGVIGGASDVFQLPAVKGKEAKNGVQDGMPSPEP
jgi:signal peptidase complex subunit 3